MHLKKNRWWWKVRLPGEKKPKDRALKTAGSRSATTDRATATEIAFQMWQTAIRTETEARAKAETAQKINKLEKQFLEKVKAFTKTVDRSAARARAEAKARAVLEAKLDQILAHTAGGATCQCCGREDLCEDDLYRIDSGQLLCPDCLKELRDHSQQSNLHDRYYLASDR